MYIDLNAQQMHLLKLGLGYASPSLVPEVRAAAKRLLHLLDAYAEAERRATAKTFRLSAAQRAMLAEVIASAQPRRYNDRMRRTVDALHRAGLVDYDIEVRGDDRYTKLVYVVTAPPLPTAEDVPC